MMKVNHNLSKIICVIFIFLIGTSVTLAGKGNFFTANIFFLELLFSGILWGIYCFFIKGGKYSLSIILQAFIICVIFALFWDLCLLHNRSDNVNWFFLIIGFFAIHTNLCFFGKELLLRRKELHIKEYLYHRRHLIFLLLPLTAILLFTINSVSVWDMTDYERVISKLKVFDYTMNTFSFFTLGGHTSWGYSLLASIGEFIFPINGVGIRIIHIIIAIVTVIFFHDIVEFYFPRLSDSEYLLCSIVFAVSPLFLGLTHYISPDYGVLCFFVWMVFAHTKKFSLFQIFATFLTCFSKEPGVILCFFYYFSYALYQAWHCKEKRLKKFFFDYNFYYICFIIAPALLFCIYTFLGRGGMWGSGTQNGPIKGFLIDRRHIFAEMKVIFGGNFCWIYLLFIIIGIVLTIFLRNKRQYDRALLWTTLGCFVGYTVFCCLYVNYNHFRYIQVFTFQYTILFIYALRKYKAWFRKGILIILSSLLFIQNFITIDPVMYRLFNVQEVENMPMITTRNSWDFPEYNVSDSIVYNYQYQYYFKCIGRFLAEINYDGTQLILFPNINTTESSSSYCLLGNTRKKDVLYYVPGSKSISIYNIDLDFERQYLETNGFPINALFIDTEFNLNDVASKYTEIYYIEPHLGYQNMNMRWEVEQIDDIRYATTYITYYKVRTS